MARRRFDRCATHLATTRDGTVLARVGVQLIEEGYDG